MGYELDQLMKAYGVSSPSISYAGIADPGTAPKQTDTIRTISPAIKGTIFSKGTPETIVDRQLTPEEYQAATSKYQNDLGQYNRDMAAYDQYKTDYENRIKSGSIYNQPQFQNIQNVPAPNWSGVLNTPKYGQPAPSIWSNGLGSLGSFVTDTANKVSSNSFFDRISKALNLSHGGLVKTHYYDGGTVQGAAAEGAQEASNSQLPAQQGTVPPQLLEMLNKYTSGESTYGPELQAARGKANAEAEAFQRYLQNAMEGNGLDKAEMYFRLASAFGAPTKTGKFSETIGNVGATMGEYTKGQQALKTQLGLESQKLKMQNAKEDLATLRTLAGEEMKDKRAISAELLKDYIKSGQPQSSAGKQAQDEGLKPGTPEFQKRVAQISDMNVEKQMASINATLANMSVAQANLALNQNKFENQKAQQAKLTPTELKLKTETEDLLAASDAGMKALSQAYKLNPNTFDASLPDLAQRKLLEASGRKDTKLENTRLMENLLAEKALSGLKAAFGGNPTEGERKIMLDVQGIGAKSVEERGKIMKSAYAAMKVARERQNKRLNEINQGLYRETNPAPAGEGIE